MCPPDGDQEHGSTGQPLQGVHPNVGDFSDWIIYSVEQGERFDIPQLGTQGKVQAGRNRGFSQKDGKAGEREEQQGGKYALDWDSSDG